MDITKDGEQKIKRWKYASELITSLKSQLSKAECELKNAETDLAKWLLPKDAISGEVIAVWFGDSLISAKHVDGNHSCVLRTRGKSWEN